MVIKFCIMYMNYLIHNTHARHMNEVNAISQTNYELMNTIFYRLQRHFN